MKTIFQIIMITLCFSVHAKVDSLGKRDQALQCKDCKFEWFQKMEKNNFKIFHWQDQIPFIPPNLDLVRKGDRIGNGGDIVVCEEGAPVLLDFYEAQIMRGIDVTEREGSDYKQILREVLDSYSGYSPFFMRSLWLEVEKFETDSLFLEDIELVDIPDSEHLALKKGCSLKQIAIQSEPEFPGDKRFIVDKDLWDSLSSFQQAGLVLHEVLHKFAIRGGAFDSRGVRYLNSLIFSDRFFNLNDQERHRVLKLADQPLFDARDKEGYFSIPLYTIGACEVGAPHSCVNEIKEVNYLFTPEGHFNQANIGKHHKMINPPFVFKGYNNIGLMKEVFSASTIFVNKNDTVEIRSEASELLGVAPDRNFSISYLSSFSTDKFCQTDETRLIYTDEHIKFSPHMGCTRFGDLLGLPEYEESYDNLITAPFISWFKYTLKPSQEFDSFFGEIPGLQLEESSGVIKVSRSLIYFGEAKGFWENEKGKIYISSRTEIVLNSDKEVDPVKTVEGRVKAYFYTASGIKIEIKPDDELSILNKDQEVYLVRGQRGFTTKLVIDNPLVDVEFRDYYSPESDYTNGRIYPRRSRVENPKEIPIDNFKYVNGKIIVQGKEIALERSIVTFDPETHRIVSFVPDKDVVLKNKEDQDAVCKRRQHCVLDEQGYITEDYYYR